MAAVFSKLLGSASNVSTSTVALYTVPAGFRAVVRDITIYQNATPLLPNNQFSFQTTTPTVLFWVVPVWQYVTGKTYHWEGRQVMNAGNVLNAVITGSAFYIRVSGYELTLP